MLIPNSLAQEEVQLPDWIKNVAGWWSNDMISENEFLNAIEYLVNNNIIPLDAIPCTPFAENSTAVPSWIKNNAGWWATEQITDTAFYTGIKYLIDEQHFQWEKQDQIFFLLYLLHQNCIVKRNDLLPLGKTLKYHLLLF